MRRAAIALCLAISLAGSGCVAFNEPLSRPVAEPRSPDPRLAALHVRVRRPALDDPLPPERRKGRAPADVLEFRTHDSDLVISALSKSGAFASVAYLDTGAPEPNVVIEAVEPQHRMCDGKDILLPILSLGLIPAICERDRGIYFHFVDRKLPDFTCAWPQTEMVGWLGALLGRGFGDWTAAPNDAAFVSHVRACIAQSGAF